MESLIFGHTVLEEHQMYEVIQKPLCRNQSVCEMNKITYQEVQEAHEPK